MKLLVNIAVAILGIFIGFAAGLRFEKVRHTGADVEQLLESQFREQHGTTFLSLAVFEKLEAGDIDKANFLLARQMALYHHLYKDQDAALPQGPCLIPLIEKAGARSPVLQTELQKPIP